MDIQPLLTRRNSRRRTDKRFSLNSKKEKEETQKKLNELNLKKKQEQENKKNAKINKQVDAMRDEWMLFCQTLDMSHRTFLALAVVNSAVVS